MPSSVWLSHDKQKKLHSFLEHLFSQVGQLNICTDVTFSGHTHNHTHTVPTCIHHLLELLRGCGKAVEMQEKYAFAALLSCFL